MGIGLPLTTLPLPLTALPLPLTAQASAANGTMNINETGQLFADAGFFDSAYRC